MLNTLFQQRLHLCHYFLSPILIGLPVLPHSSQVFCIAPDDNSILITGHIIQTEMVKTTQTEL